MARTSVFVDLELKVASESLSLRQSWQVIEEISLGIQPDLPLRGRSGKSNSTSAPPVGSRNASWQCPSLDNVLLVGELQYSRYQQLPPVFYTFTWLSKWLFNKKTRWSWWMSGSQKPEPAYSVAQYQLIGHQLNQTQDPETVTHPRMCGAVMGTWSPPCDIRK